jgi:hypothetical protein
MSIVDLANQVAPDAPAAGRSRLFVDPTSKVLSIRDDAGNITTLSDLANASVAAQGPGFAADTYLAGSNVALGNRVPKVRTLYQCTFDVSKTAAGTVAPVIILRIGTLGTTADAARVTFTFPAQTAAADVGTFSIWALFRTVGAGTAAVVQGRAHLVHKGTATGLTGLSIEPGPTVQAVSAGFDSAVASSIIGLSVNGGTSAAWTVQLVEAKVENI